MKSEIAARWQLKSNVRLLLVEREGRIIINASVWRISSIFFLEREREEKRIIDGILLFFFLQQDFFRLFVLKKELANTWRQLCQLFWVKREKPININILKMFFLVIFFFSGFKRKRCGSTAWSKFCFIIFFNIFFLQNFSPFSRANTNIPFHSRVKTLIPILSLLSPSLTQEGGMLLENKRLMT